MGKVASGAAGADGASSFAWFAAPVNSSGSVNTLSLEDSWLGGIEISVTTMHLLANRQESVTSSVVSWFWFWFGASSNNVSDDPSRVLGSVGSAAASIDFRDSSSFSSFPCP